MADQLLTVYIDYKSPYAYLAVEPTWTLARDYKVTLEWLPYTLDIPDYLGSAKVNNDGQILENDRTPHQWRKVKYSYMDARRYANLRGLTIRGPQKIWDSSLASVGLLYAQKHGKFREYNGFVFDRFWRRELDIEDAEVIQSVLSEIGVDATGFDSFVASEGRLMHDQIRAEAEKKGIFGVPTYVLGNEIFWGREHLPLVRLRLNEMKLTRPGIDVTVDTTHAWRPLGPGW